MEQECRVGSVLRLCASAVHLSKLDRQQINV